MKEVREIVDGMNETGHPALTGAAPEDVEDNDDLTFYLTKRNLQHARENAARRETKHEKLRRLGGFRTLARRARSVDLKRRIAEPWWSADVKPVGKLEGQTVEDANTGTRYPLVEVLPVPLDSTLREAVEQPRALGLRDVKAREKLQDVANVVRDALEDDADGKLTSTQIFRTAISQAELVKRLSQAKVGTKRAPLRYLARTFPELFQYVEPTQRGPGSLKLVVRRAAARPARPRFKAGVLKRPAEEPPAGAGVGL